MPADWLPNSGSQLERALRAYFISVGAIPNPKHPTKGIHCTLETNERSNPLRTILAHDASEEVPFTGNDVYDVTIVDQFDGLAQDGERNPEQRRAIIDEQIGRMMKAMLQTDDEATLLATCKNITDSGRALATTGTAREQANNADMTEFTCLFIVPNGKSRGHPREENSGIDETTWREVRRFRITVAPCAIVGYSNTSGQ